MFPESLVSKINNGKLSEDWRVWVELITLYTIASVGRKGVYKITNVITIISKIKITFLAS